MRYNTLKEYFAFLTLLCFILTSFFPQTHATITDPEGAGDPTIDLTPNLRLWLDANDTSTLYSDSSCSTNISGSDGDTIQCWADKSSYGDNVTQETLSYSPTYIADGGDEMNNQPALQFMRASSQALEKDIVDWTGDYTMFIVFEQLTDAPAFASFFSNGDNGSVSDNFQIGITSDGSTFAWRNSDGQLDYEAESINELKLYSTVGGDDSTVNFVDGTEVSSNTAGGGNVFDAYVINRNRRPQPGTHNDSKIAEVIIYDKKLDSCEQTNVNLYLGEKYGRDFSSIPVNYDEITTHTEDIGGIGVIPSTCVSPIVFNKASSDEVTVSINEGGNNYANHDLDTVGQDEFLTFAHDGAAISTGSVDLGPYNSFLSRTWRVDTDDGGTDTSSIDTDEIVISNVSVAFDLTALGITSVSDVSQYALAIDRDNDGDFSNAEFINANMSYDGSNLSFDNVDLIEGNYFGLVTGRDDDISVSVEQKSTQADPTNIDSATFSVVFDAQINGSTFTASDITLTGSTATVTSGPTDIGLTTAGLNYEFTVSGMTHNDTVIATIGTGAVDAFVAGLTSKISTSSDNSVTYDNVAPANPIIGPLSPNPAQTGETVTQSFIFVEQGAVITVPGMTCTPSPADASGSVACTATATGGLLDGSNNTITLTDAAGNTNTLVTPADTLVIDDTAPIVTISPVTKLNNASITDTTIVVTDNIGINASDVTVGTGSTTTSNFTCTQSGATQVHCSISVDVSGKLIINALDTTGNSDSDTELNYIVDTTNPNLPSISVNTDAPYSLNAPQVTFSSLDNVAIDHFTITYNGDNGTTGIGTSTTDDPVTSPVILSLDPDEVLHAVTVTVYDTAGNSSSSTVQFPPSIVFNVPTTLSGSTITDSTVTITNPSGNDISNIILTPGETNATLGTCTGSGSDLTSPYTNPVTCTINNITGSGTLSISGDDASIGATGFNSQSYIIDTILPIITITAPKKLDNKSITNTTVSVIDDMGILAANVIVGSGTTASTSSYICSQTNASRVDCTISIDASGDLTISVVDNAGNIATKDEDSYVIDLIAPTTPVVGTLSPNPTQSGETVTVPITGVEEGATITIEGMSCSPNPADSTGEVSCTSTSTGGLLDGTNNTITITDPAGNTNTGATVETLVIDDTAPTTPVVGTLSPNPTQSGKTVTVPITGVEEGASITIEGMSCSPNPADSTGEVSCTSTSTGGLLDGTNNTITITDPAGNTNSGATVETLVIDDTAPVITLSGSTIVSLFLGDLYTDLGSTWSDNEDGTGSLIATGGPVTTTGTGNFTLSYNYTDVAGNVGNTVTRTVSVFDPDSDIDEDGLTAAEEILLGTNPTDNDTAGDGGNDDGDTDNDFDQVSNIIEIRAPNNGDGNGDNAVDALQDHVASLPNVMNAVNYNSVETFETGTTNACGLTSVESLLEASLSSDDTSFEYPLGLWDFSTDCGSSIDVKIYLDKVYDTNSWIYKKFNTTTNIYSDMSSDVIYATETVGANVVTTISYTVIDNGPLDENLAVGIIRDPSGPAIQDIGSGNSGGGSRTYSCRDEAANNYERFGFSDPELCEYDEVVIEEENEVNPEEIVEINSEEENDVIEEKVETHPETEGTDIEEIVDESTVADSVINEEYTIENNFASCPTITDIQNPLYTYKSSDVFGDEGESNFTQEILKFKEIGIVDGYDDGNFGPQNTMTRTEFLKVALISHCYEYKNEDASDLKYTDVDISSWQANVIKKAEILGMINGDVTESGIPIFRPDDVISKAEATKILMKMANIQATNPDDLAYDDITTPWHVPYIRSGQTLGLFDTNNKQFTPDDGVSRENMVHLINKLVGLYR